ncbi:excinuclease ABC subunit UvrB [Entomospira culicis]|uniref:UvrABC system protein B n=1 Tax=Entomospira culicis TaxID=2719989 RepID=A0A968GKP6_9SPIO|nr:excinuclease ABC subunit UvrB [Entomospira culicis]NIZ19485.1 excinuclease ABC subunit UvrB [Entomospira culicis]NIZ69610.1 excinuclease ABC subunit UvrB [Entomospira culicis]WDI36721.1 excinuclease ABC subunit UvrB [Entomospira culicis]WDI38350.1 excinuclease ABC subunit UvrB [Entomospira culicis]
MQRRFEVVANYQPAGDQPQAIASVVQAIEAGDRYHTLQGVTGSGKTYTMAKIVEQVQRPTLVISHNKTLAAQLYREFKEFFPNNAVEYFVSYYDYYQPEAYVVARDLYIEKDSSINDEIERMRLSAAASLLEREDVLVVATVSCIYGAGNPENFKAMRIILEVGQTLSVESVIRSLIQAQYQRNDDAPKAGEFRRRGDVLEIFLAYAEPTPRFDEDERANRGWDSMFRIEWEWDKIVAIYKCHTMTGAVIESRSECVIYPAKNFVVEPPQMSEAIARIEADLAKQIAHFESLGKSVEALRIGQRTRYDLEMLREMGSCSGIENYSRYIDGREPGMRPSTLIDYFPENFITFMDESHVTRSQVGAMYEGDKSRKLNLVNFGFRLPGAMDNRPLKIEEFETLIPQMVYVSATPGSIELERSSSVSRLVIRPTGLLDPMVEVRPTHGQIEDLYAEIRRRIAQDERAIVLTLTKKMAEDMTSYFSELGLKVSYLHSEIETIERVEILHNLRLGKIDVVIGVNLLREGIDLPEVSFIAIMDADKIGFLRSATSLTQIIGRAARHESGMAVMYADKMSSAMQEAIAENRARRALQEEYNTKHGITPHSVKKSLTEILSREQEHLASAVEMDLSAVRAQTNFLEEKSRKKYLKELEKRMLEYAKNWEYEEAALVRDEIDRIKRGEYDG